MDLGVLCDLFFDFADSWKRMAETKNTETKSMKEEQSMHDRDFPVKEFSLTPVGVTVS